MQSSAAGNHASSTTSPLRWSGEVVLFDHPNHLLDRAEKAELSSETLAHLHHDVDRVLRNPSIVYRRRHLDLSLETSKFFGVARWNRPHHFSISYERIPNGDVSILVEEEELPGTAMPLRLETTMARVDLAQRPGSLHLTINEIENRALPGSRSKRTLDEDEIERLFAVRSLIE